MRSIESQSLIHLCCSSVYGGGAGAAAANGTAAAANGTAAGAFMGGGVADMMT